MIREDVKGQLYWIALWGNSLADAGKTTTFDEVYAHLRNGKLLTWMSDHGAVMSLQLSDVVQSLDVIEPTLSTLAAIAEGKKGRESKKLAVHNNGWCLLVALVLEALAVDEEFTE